MKKVAETYARVLAEVLSPDLDKKELSRRIDSFVALLLEQHALHLCDGIVERFSKLFDARIGMVTAEITIRDAHAFDAEAVRTALEKRLNKKVELTVVEDSNVLGGARLRVGDHIYDNTLAARLFQLRQQLTV